MSGKPLSTFSKNFGSANVIYIVIRWRKRQPGVDRSTPTFKVWSSSWTNMINILHRKFWLTSQFGAGYYYSPALHMQLTIAAPLCHINQRKQTAEWWSLLWWCCFCSTYKWNKVNELASPPFWQILMPFLDNCLMFSLRCIYLQTKLFNQRIPVEIILDFLTVDFLQVWTSCWGQWLSLKCGRSQRLARGGLQPRGSLCCLVLGVRGQGSPGILKGRFTSARRELRGVDEWRWLS